MKPIDSFSDYVIDLLEYVNDMDIKKMFGGVALLHNGSAFAKIKNGSVWLKVDNSNIKRFIDRGMKQYRYGKDNSRKLNFYEMPGDIIEDRDEFYKWVKESITIIDGE